MQNDNIGANQDCPTDGSTGLPESDSRDRVSDEKTRGCAGSGPSSGDQTRPRVENTRDGDDLPGNCPAVLEHVRELLADAGGDVYLKAADVDIDELSSQQIGTAFARLSRADIPELEIEEWSRTYRGATWRVQMTDVPIIDADQPYVADCQDCEWAQTYHGTDWKLPDEQARMATGGHRHHHPDHEIDIYPADVATDGGEQ